MTDVGDLLARNAAFAAGRPVSGLRINPFGNLMVIGCVDPRVDPTSIFGLELGEAAVLRNVGGRVTPETVRTMALLSKVGQANADGRREGDWNVVVLHHTDCGMTDLEPFPELLATYFEIPPAQVPTRAVSDPVRSVRVDVDVIRAGIAGGRDSFVSGLVYDVTTGVVEVVVEPLALGTA